MTAVIARIALRYAAGALVSAGLLDSDMGQQMGADPDLLILFGMGMGVLVETGYAIAKKMGWTT